MCHAKGRLWPTIAHLLPTTSLTLLASTFRSSHQCKLRSELAVCLSKHQLSLICCGPWSSGLWPCGAHEIPIPVFTQSSMSAKANIGFRSMPGFHAFIANTISMINAWYKGKVGWYPHANKLLKKCAAVNMHSRGPTEQYFYVWEPHRGCLHKVKKCTGTPH